MQRSNSTKAQEEEGVKARLDVNLTNKGGETGNSSHLHESIQNVLIKNILKAPKSTHYAQLYTV